MPQLALHQPAPHRALLAPLSVATSPTPASSPPSAVTPVDMNLSPHWVPPGLCHAPAWASHEEQGTSPLELPHTPAPASLAAHTPPTRIASAPAAALSPPGGLAMCNTNYAPRRPRSTTAVELCSPGAPTTSPMPAELPMETAVPTGKEHLSSPPTSTPPPHIPRPDATAVPCKHTGMSIQQIIPSPYLPLPASSEPMMSVPAPAPVAPVSVMAPCSVPTAASDSVAATPRSPTGVYNPYETATEQILWECDIGSPQGDGDGDVPATADYTDTDWPSTWHREIRRPLSRQVSAQRLSPKLTRRSYKALVRGHIVTNTMYQSEAFTSGGLQWALRFGRQYTNRTTGSSSGSSSDSDSDSDSCVLATKTASTARRPLLTSRITRKHNQLPSGQQGPTRPQPPYFFHLVCLSAHLQQLIVECEFRCLGVNMQPLSYGTLKLCFQPCATINDSRRRNAVGVDSFIGQEDTRRYSGTEANAEGLTLCATVTMQIDKETGLIKDALS